MIDAAAPACLVAPASRALRATPGFLCAGSSAIDLATIAAAADEDLSPAARTQEEPSRRLVSPFAANEVWTNATTGEILPRHSCAARCVGHGAESTWPLRSAPRLPLKSGRFLSRFEAFAGLHAEELWICGQRCAFPTYPQRNYKQKAVKLNN
jgi:hypothetical protein